jgi:hypothetical protein
MAARISESEASKDMLAANFQPTTPYPGTQLPWFGTCLTCNREGSPRYTRVRQGESPCKWCNYQKLSRNMRLDHEQAVEVMREANFEPSVPYVDGKTPWLGQCMECGWEGSPTYKHVKSGASACKPCGRGKARIAQSRDPESALQVMLAAGFKPDDSYPGANTPWPGVCLTCGTRSQPSYSTVSSGHNPCRKCAMVESGAKVRERDADKARAEMLLVGFEPSGPYPGSHGRWPGTCLRCGHVGTASIHSIRRGQGACKPCGTLRTADMQRTPEKAARELMILHDFRPQVPFVNSRTPWEGICLNCGTVSSPTHSSVASGNGPCWTCSRVKSGAKRRNDALKTREVMLEAGFSPFDEYRGASTPWHGVCLRCGNKSSPTYSSVARGGNPCRKCSSLSGGLKRRLDPNAAHDLMIKANFQPSVPFPGSVSPWPGVCLVCGMSGSPRYKHVSRGIGACLYCAGTKPDSVILVGKAMAADFLPDSPYPGARKPWSGVCLKCENAISPMMSNIDKGRGACRFCGTGGFDASIPGWFYLITDGQVVKGGITNVPEKRLHKHLTQGLDRVLHLVEFSSGRDALAMEGLWMEYLASRRAFAVEKVRLPDGYTEAVHIHDGLDHFIETIVGLSLTLGNVAIEKFIVPGFHNTL